ncbi:MAG: polyhydroxyalkanoate biosynthesis repressor PhaR [Nitrospirae bacterium]|nr:MAG: polyhydroxyalkanoate biosynthesis repressor PhaR [Nitrospirota bacterium]
MRQAAVRIGRHTVGEGHPPFVVAEVGINHNGDIKKALQMVRAAKEAGAHCIKFQTHITAKEMVHTDMTPGEISSESLWDIIQRCELTEADERRVKEACDEAGILFLSTPFSREATDQLEQLDVPAYKIGSGEITNLPLIEHVARKGKPMIVSTGMTELEEVEATVDLIRGYGVPLILLQCTSTYPTAYSDVKLGAIKLLRERFGVPVGLSDHSIGIYTALGSVALGACFLEKHFTMSRTWPGPDQGLSIEPDELRELARGAEAIYQALGSDKLILDKERPVVGFARASVVVVRPVAAGERLTEDNLWVKRPADGEIPAKDYKKLIGKVARVAMTPDHQVKWSEVA